MTKKESGYAERLKYWKNHIAQAERFEGSIPAYCRSAGIRDHTFYYWQKKLRAKKTIPGLNTSSFIRAEVAPAAVERHGLKLPDPKWVAAIILSLQEGLR